MTFPRTVTDRIVEYPNRRRLTPVPGQTDVFDVSREEGTILEEGTAINKNYLQPIEDGLDDVYNKKTTPHTQSESIKSLPLASLDGSVYNFNAKGLSIVDPVDGLQNIENLKAESVGKNLFDGEFERGLFDPLNGEKLTNANFIRNKNPIKIKGSTLYSITTIAGDGFIYYDSNMNFISFSGSIEETPLNARFINFYFNVSDLNIDVMFNLGENLLSFEPHKSSQLTINVPLRSLPNLVADEVKESDEESWLEKNVEESQELNGTALNTTNLTGAKTNGSFIAHQTDGTTLTGIIDGSVTLTADAKVHYELATPEPINLTEQGLTTGELLSFENGTVYQSSDTFHSQELSFDVPTNLASKIDGNTKSVNALSKQIAVNTNASNQALEPIKPDSIVGTTLNVTTPTKYRRFTLDIDTDITGGDILIALNGELSLNLKNTDGSNVTELLAESRFYEVIADATFFTLISKGSLVKNVQHISGVMNPGIDFVDVVIGEVDLSKSFISNVTVKTSAPGDGPDESKVRAKFLNSTTVRFNVHNNNNTFVPHCQVTELSKVKSLQSGTKSTTTTSDTISVSSVDISKSLLFSSYDTNTSLLQHQECATYLLNSTTIQLDSKYNADRDTDWFLAEL